MDYEEILKTVDHYLSTVSKDKIKQDLEMCMKQCPGGPTIAEYFESFGDEYELMRSNSSRNEPVIAPDVV